MQIKHTKGEWVEKVHDDVTACSKEGEEGEGRGERQVRNEIIEELSDDGLGRILYKRKEKGLKGKTPYKDGIVRRLRMRNKEGKLARRRPNGRTLGSGRSS